MPRADLRRARWRFDLWNTAWAPQARCHRLVGKARRGHCSAPAPMHCRGDSSWTDAELRTADTRKASVSAAW